MISQIIPVLKTWMTGCQSSNKNASRVMPSLPILPSLQIKVSVLYSSTENTIKSHCSGFGAHADSSKRETHQVSTGTPHVQVLSVHIYTVYVIQCPSHHGTLCTLSFSHFVSAKTNDMINACFLKIAADVMKVKLTTADIQRVTVSTNHNNIYVCVCSCKS